MGARVVLSLDGRILAETALARAVTVVGRHPSCDIVIDHPAISGRHLIFRGVDTTVYVEDLASTNGTKVNGLAVSHQVVHHLDLIEIGRHKIHFFDESLIVGSVQSLESTVLTDYERTMLASHMASPPPPAHPKADPEADLSGTTAMQAYAMPVENAASAEAAEVASAIALRVVGGSHKGELIHLDRANTMIGNGGADTALVVRRGQGYFLARFGGRPPRLNLTELGPGAHPLAPRDTIEVGDSRFEVVRLTP
jgi:pSer/pThr/pTyr-binding forkhead associated (FHA) protein